MVCLRLYDGRVPAHEFHLWGTSHVAMEGAKQNPSDTASQSNREADDLEWTNHPRGTACMVCRCLDGTWVCAGELELRCATRVAMKRAERRTLDNACQSNRKAGDLQWAETGSRAAAASAATTSLLALDFEGTCVGGVL